MDFTMYKKIALLGLLLWCAGCAGEKAQPISSSPPLTNNLPAAAEPAQPLEPAAPEPKPEPLPEAEVQPLSAVNIPPEVRSPYTAIDPVSGVELSNQTMAWYLNLNSEHQPPTAQRVFDIREYGAYYLGDINEKVIYLTFDEGYENGFTPAILDILKEKQVPAAFFMTKSYIQSRPDLAARIVEEGHVAANHSVTHPSLPDLSDEDIIYEIEETARYFEEATGYRMQSFFRPPRGEYSERSLYLTKQAGWDSVFWSYAHRDWLVDEQPGKTVTYNRVMDNLHPGEILLLHAVSESNTQALPDLIDAIRALGFEFRSLQDIR
jgi:peptidoglycan-N-acetylmuramic acid deacetylase